MRGDLEMKNIIRLFFVGIAVPYSFCSFGEDQPDNKIYEALVNWEAASALINAHLRCAAIAVESNRYGKVEFQKKDVERHLNIGKKLAKDVVPLYKKYERLYEAKYKNNEPIDHLTPDFYAGMKYQEFWEHQIDLHTAEKLHGVDSRDEQIRSRYREQNCGLLLEK